MLRGGYKKHWFYQLGLSFMPFKGVELFGMSRASDQLPFRAGTRCNLSPKMSDYMLPN